jgi:hypothetical protein
MGWRSEESVEREKEEEEETKGKRNLSCLEGHFGKVVAISILGKSPDSCSLNARPSSRSKTGQRTKINAVLP